jgi:quinoprotein glucose dehydrogenase
MRLPRLLVLLTAPALLTAALAVDPATPTPAKGDPELPDGTDKAVKHMATFRVPAGVKVTLFAAEPKLASPVAISVDDKGRVFVAEEHRLGRGAAENRDNAAFKFSFFLDDDLRSNTLADRLANYKKWQAKMPGGMDWFSKYSDQVRLVEDTDGDGKADKSSVFAGGFNDPLDGLAAGVLAHNGDVYFTCIPNLWKLRDTKGTGVADQREKLLTGFGPNIAFFGHDLHGLIVGPDGKLYFSVGDRGFDVTSKEGKHFTGPRNGAVFRCDMDGSNFEVVMRGLRNPQELAFDEYGNLFADDNNCDKGDHGRLVYVLEDADAGWNMAYQTIPAPYMAGPWFAERMWHLPNPGQPAWMLPPVGKIGTGPAGFLFTSGTSLPARYKNAFIMCNYTGGGGLESWRLKPKGAGYEIEDYHDFLKPIMATDVEQGPDGKLYVSDFVNLDWSGKSLGGRVYAVFDEQKQKSADATETKELFAAGFAQRKPAELAKLLVHPEMRVRQRAQFALAEKGAADTLAAVAAKDAEPLARLHAIWGLGQIARKNPDAIKPAVGLLDDPDAEVKAQAAKAIGDAKFAGAEAKLIALLGDPSPRVKHFAAVALGKLQHKPAVNPLFDVLKANKDADPFLRHAAVAALVRIGDADAVAAKSADESAAVRLGVVLVQRKLGDKRVSRFLADADLFVRTEAARAVHDLPMTDLYPELAKVLAAVGGSVVPDIDPLVRRGIDANFVLGRADHAKAVLGVVLNPNFPEAVRAEALFALRDWAEPPQRDRVTGFWRVMEKRDAAVVRGVVEPAVAELLAKTSGKLQSEAVSLIGKLGVKADEGTFAAWVADPNRDPNTRSAALRILGERKSKFLEGSLAVALKDNVPAVRSEAREVLAATDPARGVTALAAVFDDDAAAVSEKQRAILALPRVKDAKASKLLDEWAVKLADAKVPAELRVDVHDALKAAPSATRDAHRAKYEAGVPRDPVGKFRDAHTGGDADRGRDIFFGHTAAQCVRCHVVNGVGGVAGPDLSKVAAKYPEKTREHFVESLALPNAKIADGYAAVTFTLADGRVIAGVVLAEDKTQVTVQTPDGKKQLIAAEDIDARTTPTSPMPPMDRTLSPREVRDLLEFLTTLK